MKCVVCKSEINEGARLCPICRSHQSAFKRAVFYIAGITGFLSLLGSALFFITLKANEFKKELVWKDSLKIVNFMSDGVVCKYTSTMVTGIFSYLMSLSRRIIKVRKLFLLTILRKKVNFLITGCQASYLSQLLL